MLTVGLVTIVRDEQQALPRLLEQVEPLVDTVTIVDTGSRDRTPKIARDAARRLDGRFHTRPWRDFARNRTEALKLAQGTADYHLMLDADHTLEVNGYRPDLTADSYLVKVTGAGDEWRLPLLTRDGHPFEYRGAAHAYLASDAPTVSLPTDWLTVRGGGGVTREKLERDRDLLEAALLDDPTDTRSIFYLAQTYRDLGDHQRALVFYRLRASMHGGFGEERYWARYQAGVILGEHIALGPAADELLAAWRDRPHRVEALRALANLCNSVADKIPYPQSDNLFVRASHYREGA